MCRHALAAALTAALIVAACGTDDTTPKAVIDPGDDGNYTVDIEPADFTSTIDNPYLPMPPGSRWRYEETGEDGETEIITVKVLDELRTVMGVETIVVHDVVTTEDGDVVEDTYDWYAQDTDGNVWYFGEDTTAYEDGAASTAGSWQAGVDGALPGIVMLAAPEGVRHRLPAGVLPGRSRRHGSSDRRQRLSEHPLRRIRRRHPHPRLDAARTRHRRGEDIRPRRRLRTRGQDQR